MSLDVLKGWGGLGALVACACVLATAPAAQAQPIGCTVDDLVDAIDTANANADATTIELAAGCTYTFTTVDNPTFGGNGLPVVSTPITVEGNGATLRRDPAAPPMRFLLVGAGR